MQRTKSILKGLGLALGGVAMACGVAYWLLPTGPRDPMRFDDPWNEPRPMVRAGEHVAVTGTPWATDVATKVLERGGNAFDAGVAALLMLNVTFGEAASFPSVAPNMIHLAETGEVRSYVGAGTAPARATIERFREAGYETVPDFHIWAQLLPASPDVIVTLLREHGRMSFGELVAPAIERARKGFPVHKIMARNLDFPIWERLGFRLLMPSTAEVYLKGEWWRPIHYKDRFTRPDLADTFAAMAEAEQAVRDAGGSRREGLQAVRDHFYEGPVAEAIAAFHEEEGGLLTKADLAGYESYWETPLRGAYGDYTFYVNGPWSQGIVTPLALQILDGIDLERLGHNSPEYVHRVVQAIELAMADREGYVGDPAFVEVPSEALLREEHAARRRAAMSDRAFAAMPTPGEVPGREPYVPETVARRDAPASSASLLTAGRDTSHLAIIDAEGNAITLTPSDFPQSPMIPDTGLTLGIRMTQFRLDPEHPAALQPGKRPRITPNAAIVFEEGEFFMAFGTPGGDMQTQALVQVFLNMAVFDMSVQEAIEAPRFRSRNFPDSFAPHEMEPHTLEMEASLYEAVGDAMSARGYDVERYADWDNNFGAVGAVLRKGGGLRAGSDPREDTWAEGR